MKKIGLFGGISWTSSIDYYKLINEGVNAKLGGLNLSECIIYSIHFGGIYTQSWDDSFDLILNACESLKQAGAEILALCANTAHLYADRFQLAINLLVIDMVSETAKTINKSGLKKIGLLGAKFTMQMNFYRLKLESFGLEVNVPEKKESRDYIQFTLREELGVGYINPITKERYGTNLELRTKS